MLPTPFDRRTINPCSIQYVGSESQLWAPQGHVILKLTKWPPGTGSVYRRQLPGSGGALRAIPVRAVRVAPLWPRSASVYRATGGMRLLGCPGPAVRQQEAILGISLIVVTLMLGQARKNGSGKDRGPGKPCAVSPVNLFCFSTSLYTQHPENTFGQEGPGRGQESSVHHSTPHDP